MSNILITGGTGFIGSHTCLLLLNEGHTIYVVDNLSNSSEKVIDRIKSLTIKEDYRKNLHFFNGDIRDNKFLSAVFDKARQENSGIDSVVHFAGLKSVAESISRPLDYWDTNVNGTIVLLETMKLNNCKTIVFSSSATVYGYPISTPINESDSVQPINPYGQTKAAVERLLHDVSKSEPDEWRIACLRYFNPVGAHPSGLMGECPSGIPNNLFPYVSQVASGHLECLYVFGNDWPTNDGSGVRDYIHVMDLAEGHIATLNTLTKQKAQTLTLNLGSGKGISVFEVIKQFEETCGSSIKSKVTTRRQGDAALTVADPTLAKSIIRWQTSRDLKDMCTDSWRWQKLNPDGYE